MRNRPLGLAVLAVLAPGACAAGSGPVDSGGVSTDAVVDAPSEAPCTVLFGLPNDQTGLTDEQCRPVCDCEGRRFVPPDYDDGWIAALEGRVLTAPMSAPDEDPYERPDLHVPRHDEVCGVLADTGTPGGYRLQTYDDVASAEADGAKVSHEGACGLCSTLADLAVYMRHPDLTDPVRACGMLGITQGDDEMMDCLLDLGFSVPCATIWFYNTKHTQAQCLEPCMALFNEPYHDPETGALNACLLCDEERSGPVFKAVAGRTRRNTGLPSSMCRPCSEVLAVVHEYP